MIEPHDPVLIKSDLTSSTSSSASVGGYSGPARLLYSAQLGLRFKMQPHLFLSPLGAQHSVTGSSDQLELTCVSRVGGLRKGGDVLVEGRAKWIIRHPAKDDDDGLGGGSSSSSGIRRQAAQTVDNWAGISSRDDDVDYDDDVDVDQLGGVGGRRSKEKIQPKGKENDNVEDDEEEDEDAQSISDSENPSRRTQPVVGSHPGKKNFFPFFEFPASLE
jgi:hypothetical protein